MYLLGTLDICYITQSEFSGQIVFLKYSVVNFIIVKTRLFQRIPTVGGRGAKD